MNIPYISMFIIVVNILFTMFIKKKFTIFGKNFLGNRFFKLIVGIKIFFLLFYLYFYNAYLGLLNNTLSIIIMVVIILVIMVEYQIVNRKIKKLSIFKGNK